MPTTKYYAGIEAAQRLQDPTEPARGEFKLDDIAAKGLAARIGPFILDNHRWLLGLARRFFPVLKLGQMVVVTRHDDVTEVLEQADVFEVPFGREMAELAGGKNFVLGMADGPEYQQQKAAILEAFNRHDMPRVQEIARVFVEGQIAHAGGRIDVVQDLVTPGAVQICRQYYGLKIDDDKAFGDWSISNSALLFADSGGDAATRRVALQGALHLRRTIDASIKAAKTVADAAIKRGAAPPADTVVARLVAMQRRAGSGGYPTDLDIRGMFMGMVSGFIPTNTLAGGSIADLLLSKSEAMQACRDAIAKGDDKGLGDCLFETLRFRAALNPGIWRYATRDYTLKSGRTIDKGMSVLASTQGAAFDSRRVADPGAFDPARPDGQSLVFGHGLHWCIGAGIARAQMVATFKALLARPGLARAAGSKGKLQRLGPFPRHLVVEFEADHGHATQTLVTVAMPVPTVGNASIKRALDTLGNPAGEAIKAALDGTRRIHFASMSLIEDVKATEPTWLILECSGDGDQKGILAAIAAKAGELLRPVFREAGLATDKSAIGDLLARHALEVVPHSNKHAGVLFCGTPGLSVDRIKAEGQVEEVARQAITAHNAAQTGMNQSAKQLLDVARDALRNKGMGWALQPRPMAEDAQPKGLIRTIVRILNEARVLIWVAAVCALATLAGFFLVLGGLRDVCALLAHPWLSGDFWAFFGKALPAIGSVIGKLFFSLIWAVLATLIVVAIAALLLRKRMNKQEKTDPAVDRDPDPAILRAIVAKENVCRQNHLTGVSILKPGRLRARTLSLAFTIVDQVAKRIFRPGFLGELGTIHFARWVRLPGNTPETHKLLFFSNYGGSWESYLEDFITKAHQGLTGVWSNTVDFPRTRDLFFDGATDGDRFKRWARHQQIPTRFWYSAYGDLTTERIRTNAWIRHGLATARTEGEAQTWLDRFGSLPRPRDALESDEIQSIVFGAMGKLEHSECILLALGPDKSANRLWLAGLTDESTARLSFGDRAPGATATFVAFTADGLTGLGLNPRTADMAVRFPLAFEEGMAETSRARVLGDEGDSAPGKWQWGGPDQAPVHVALLLYAKDEPALRNLIERELAAAAMHAIAPVHSISMRITKVKGFSQEPFGFADGISQPVIRGTSRQYKSKVEDIHVVEAGEFILGYPDSRNFLPPSPQISVGDSESRELAPPKDFADPAYRGKAAAAAAPRREIAAQTAPPLAPPPQQRPAVSGVAAVPAALTEARGAAVVDPPLPRNARDLGRNGTYLVIRQLEQDVAGFEAYLQRSAEQLWRDEHGDGADRPLPLPDSEWFRHKREWVAAKLVGRWRDGTSLVANPDQPGGGRPDNAFWYGKDDQQGLRCPFGAHIRRANPRDSLDPGEREQIDITNRHRIIRVGRPYVERGVREAAYAEAKAKGLLFMCLNGDIERNFEFIQQTWMINPSFHGLRDETDIVSGAKSSEFSMPMAGGSRFLPKFPAFVTVKGGAYFFVPGKRTLRYLATRGD